jgi:hypothetical protein
MAANKSFDGKGRPRDGKGLWVPPAITKLAIATATKSPVAGQEAGAKGPGAGVKPQPPSTPASKFGFALEWSFPLSSRTD